MFIQWYMVMMLHIDIAWGLKGPLHTYKQIRTYIHTCVHVGIQ